MIIFVRYYSLMLRRSQITMRVAKLCDASHAIIFRSIKTLAYFVVKIVHYYNARLSYTRYDVNNDKK